MLAGSESRCCAAPCTTCIWWPHAPCGPCSAVQGGAGLGCARSAWAGPACVAALTRWPLHVVPGSAAQRLLTALHPAKPLSAYHKPLCCGAVLGRPVRSVSAHPPTQPPTLPAPPTLKHSAPPLSTHSTMLRCTSLAGARLRTGAGALWACALVQRPPTLLCVVLTALLPLLPLQPALPLFPRDQAPVCPHPHPRKLP